MKRWFSRLERHKVVVHFVDPNAKSIRGYAVASDSTTATLSGAELLPDKEGEQPIPLAGDTIVPRDGVWFIQRLRAGA